MSCRTWLDHEWHPERIVSVTPHPVYGSITTTRQTCEHCDKVRVLRTPARTTSVATPQIGAAHER